MKATRRSFLRQTALSGPLAGALASGAETKREGHSAEHANKADAGPMAYPRVFEGRQLAMIAFPLGGVGAGSVSLGGRGQLRDWEIYNCANKGYSPGYAFPSIRVQTLNNDQAVSRVLESSILPPFEGQDGLGSKNAPGLPRLQGARFTGEFPLARVDFLDADVPVSVGLEAFSPFIPHNADDSGLPATILRYTVRNPGANAARVSIAWSIENTVHAGDHRRGSPEPPPDDGRRNEFRAGARLAGLMMTNPRLPATFPFQGSFALAAVDASEPALSHWTGWPRGPWWNSPMFFWDQFSRSGFLDTDPQPNNLVGSLCIERTIEPGASAQYTFLLAWHFPNRTPDVCGWEAPPGMGATLIGNWYATRFRDAWEVAEYAATNLERLEAKTKAFAAAMRESDLPAAVKDAATANLSTLVSTTCFRTADGEFHGFEGAYDRTGSCFGNCTHVWNYETATAFLFPSLARSLRRSAFGYSMDEAGAIHFRQILPDGKARFPFAAADGQMGQVVHAYLDWMLSGDEALLGELWPRVKKAVAFAWAPGSWDADRDGVMEGAQHNTYDVEFYGPNPQCGIYYLAALRAAEEMGKAAGDTETAREYRKLFDQGSKWIDANLFNGEYYIQKVQGLPPERVAPITRVGMGSPDTRNPEYQVGAGCLIDQLVGQYLAQIAGLGPLLDAKNIRSALQAIYRYNYKRSLAEHVNVARAFALNNEKAMIICDYSKAARPNIPFPYFSETMTGFEHATAAHMISAGMVREGVECIRNIRDRYDGEKRNPWDEAESGHHYARAMASWSSVAVLSGFRYNGRDAAVTIESLLPASRGFRSLWANGTGWGSYELAGGTLTVHVLGGGLRCASCGFPAEGAKTAASLNGAAIPHSYQAKAFRFATPLNAEEGAVLRLSVQS